MNEDLSAILHAFGMYSDMLSETLKTCKIALEEAHAGLQSSQMNEKLLHIKAPEYMNNCELSLDTRYFYQNLGFAIADAYMQSTTELLNQKCQDIGFRVQTGQIVMDYDVYTGLDENNNASFETRKAVYTEGAILYARAEMDIALACQDNTLCEILAECKSAVREIGGRSSALYLIEEAAASVMAKSYPEKCGMFDKETVADAILTGTTTILKDNITKDVRITHNGYHLFVNGQEYGAGELFKAKQATKKFEGPDLI